MKYEGEIEELKAHVDHIGRNGEWSGDASKWSFRSKTGEIINWWPKTGTLQCQGQRREQLEADLAVTIGSKLSFQRAAVGQTRIFIVHGSDPYALDQLRLVLYTLGLEPLVQKNVDGRGMNLFQALMSNISSESDFAIVLLTPDDYGYKKDQTETDRLPRARQNVILEAGMALAKLGSERVAIIKKGNLELPSDLEGIIRLEFNSNVKEIAAKIAQRIGGAGVPVDQRKVIEASQ
jgi:predicted nucleotide-binding protein